MLTLFWHPQWASGEGVPTFPPVADFTASRFTGNVPIAIDFTDLSTNTPTSWAWDFGDTGSSTDQNPTHTYTVAGTYTVALTSTNADGSDVETKVAYITVTDPTPYTPGNKLKRKLLLLLRRR